MTEWHWWTEMLLNDEMTRDRVDCWRDTGEMQECVVPDSVPESRRVTRFWRPVNNKIACATVPCVGTSAGKLSGEPYAPKRGHCLPTLFWLLAKLVCNRRAVQLLQVVQVFLCVCRSRFSRAIVVTALSVLRLLNCIGRDHEHVH